MSFDLDSILSEKQSSFLSNLDISDKKPSFSGGRQYSQDYSGSPSKSQEQFGKVIQSENRIEVVSQRLKSMTIRDDEEKDVPIRKNQQHLMKTLKELINSYPYSIPENSPEKDWFETNGRNLTICDLSSNCENGHLAINDSVIKFIVKSCPYLQALSLSNSRLASDEYQPITSEGVKAIFSLKELKSLTMSDVSMDAIKDGILGTRVLPSLNILNIQVDRFDEEYGKVINKFSTLSALTLSGEQIPFPSNLSWIPSRFLDKLIFQGFADVKDEAILSLIDVKQEIKWLEIDGLEGLTTVGLLGINVMKEMKTLSLGDLSLNKIRPWMLTGLAKLEKLTFKRVSPLEVEFFSESDIKYFNRLKNLKEIEFIDTPQNEVQNLDKLNPKIKITFVIDQS